MRCISGAVVNLGRVTRPCESRHGSRAARDPSSPPKSSDVTGRDEMPAFLQGPRIAVWVGEVGEAGIVATLGVKPRAPSAGPRFDRVLVPDRTDRHATSDQILPSSRDVVRDEVQVMHPASRVSHDQLYGTRRFGRRELNDSEVGGGPVVDIESEAG